MYSLYYNVCYKPGEDVCLVLTEWGVSCADGEVLHLLETEN